LNLCAACSGVAPASTLNLQGSDFLLGAQVDWGGTLLGATWISSTELQFTVPAGAPAGATVTVAVLNPGGLVSASTVDVIIAGPAPTATPIPGDGPLEISDHRPWPNPVAPGKPAFISVLLKGRADSLSLKLYTRSWVLVAEELSGPHPAGWARIGLPQAFRDAAGADAYYYVVSASRDGVKVIKPAKGAIQILR
jgi:hypothetical protein